MALKRIEASVLPNEEEPKVTSSLPDDCSRGSSDTDSAETGTVSTIIDVTVLSTIAVDEEDSDMDSVDSHMEEQWTTPMEDAQMSKAQTICICKSKDELEKAFGNHKLIAAIVIRCKHSDRPATHAVFKKTREAFWLVESFFL